MGQSSGQQSPSDHDLRQQLTELDACLAGLAHLATNVAPQEVWMHQALVQAQADLHDIEQYLWGGNVATAQRLLAAFIEEHADLQLAIQFLRIAVPEGRLSAAANGQQTWHELMAQLHSGWQAIEGRRKGTSRRAHVSAQDKQQARDKALQLWRETPILRKSDVARRIQKQWQSGDSGKVPALRTIRKWIADLS